MLKSMLFKSGKSSDSWLALDGDTSTYSNMLITEDNSIYVIYTDKDIRARVVKYSSSGEIEWSKKYIMDDKMYPDFTTITLLSDGNIAICANDGWNIFFIKINGDGNVISINSVYTNSLYPEFYSTCFFGNYIYSCGTINRSTEKTDIVYIKHNLSGTTKWIKRFKLSNNKEKTEYGASIAVDADQNVYICGTQSYNNSDLFMAKFDSSGNLQWKYKYDGYKGGSSSSSYDEGSSIAISPNGSIYICGYTRGIYDYDMYFAKCNSDGEIEWCKTISNSKTNDKNKCIRVASDETFYVCGNASELMNADSGILIVKCSSSGDIQSQKVVLNANGDTIQMKSFEIRPDKSIYVCGYSYFSTTNYGFILKIEKDIFENSEDVKIGPFIISEANFSTDITSFTRSSSDLGLLNEEFSTESVRIKSITNTSQNITIYRET